MPVPIPDTPPAVRRTLLRDNVYQAIRDAIVRGQLAPGEQLRDHELGEWLQVSRTPVREALQRLTHSGLVTSEPGRMTRVAPEDPEAVSHARQIAAELHALAVRLAFPALTASDLATMTAANDRLRSALDASDSVAAIAADDDFHEVAVSRSGNPLIRNHLEIVTATLRRAEHLHFDSLRGSASPLQHEAISAALSDGEIELAAALTRSNWTRLSQDRSANSPGTSTSPALSAGD